MRSNLPEGPASSAHSFEVWVRRKKGQKIIKEKKGDSPSSSREAQKRGTIWKEPFNGATWRAWLGWWRKKIGKGRKRWQTILHTLNHSFFLFFFLFFTFLNYFFFEHIERSRSLDFLPFQSLLPWQVPLRVWHVCSLRFLSFVGKKWLRFRGPSVRYSHQVLFLFFSFSLSFSHFFLPKGHFVNQWALWTVCEL